MVKPKKNALQVNELIVLNIYIDLLDGKPNMLGGLMVHNNYGYGLKKATRFIRESYWSSSTNPGRP